MAPVVCGIELNGYTIYEVTTKKGAYNNPKYMAYIPDSETRIRGDNGKDYWQFRARFGNNLITDSLSGGLVTPRVYSQLFESVTPTDNLNMTLHEKYDPNWGKKPVQQSQEEKDWWSKYLGNEYKNSKLRF